MGAWWIVVEQPFTSLMAADVGNSHIKLGRFDRVVTRPTAAEAQSLPTAPPQIPEPAETLQIPLTNLDGAFDPEPIQQWLNAQTARNTLWLLASVHRGAAGRLAELIDGLRADSGSIHVQHELSHRDVPLPLRVDAPQRVGLDRLAAAVAADRLRHADHPAVVVDMGTAVTVDRIDPDGAFAGGAILPGITISAQALHEHTDALPELMPESLAEPPDVLGKSTETAIASGLWWGTVGAIGELIRRLADDAAAVDVFVSGGGALRLAELLGHQFDGPVRHVPHLVLAGIALIDEASRGSPAGEPKLGSGDE